MKQLVLMIDNYDSFTYNLVQYLSGLGAEVVVYRNDAIDLRKIRRLKPKKIVISPGPGTPDDAGISNEVIEKMSGELPILGVCLGHQCIGQVFDGKIVREKPAHGKTAEIFHDGKTIFKNVKNPFTATRYHSLVVEKKSLPECLEISAWNKDKTIIMGVRHKYLPGVEGIQVHPESIMTTEGYKILRNFLNAKI